MFPDARIYSTAEEILRSADQEPFDLIHVAAHGRYDHENPMFSSIQLQDGHLLACDIARSSFQTRIATLASCDSASMGQPSGWEPQGLARAFLARKSEVVIGSLWPLNDQVAEFGFAAFYHRLKGGRSVHRSLYEARMEMKQEFIHPAFWGSLVMFGGYSS
jgi:CHAT domain-containing protein